MEGIVTLNQLLDISNAITLNAQKHIEYNQLLDESICNSYDILENKKKLQELFAKFKSARYLYDFPIENNIRTTPVYEERIGFSQRTATSQVENAVVKHLDEMIYTTDIYNSLMKASYKLTGDEVIYLINTFLIHKSEDDIAELIGISKTYLQKIKKSCIVKMWVDLKKYCSEDD